MTATLKLLPSLPPFPYPTGWSLLYVYTADLLCLDLCRPQHPHTCLDFCPVFTPLKVDAWVKALSPHPDQAFARYICDGLRFGFRIGKSASSNMLSASTHPKVVSDYIDKELRLGRMLGPFDLTRDLPSLHVNRFGVIPKGHNTGKWRLITDLSFPEGQSVNDGIDSSFCSLSYTTVDDIAIAIAQLGKGALRAKVDIESAYRLIPVNPQDRPLQAVQWDNKVYVDPMLPFGLRSAPKIFNAVADALDWYLHQSGIPSVYHYLDDFVIIGPRLRHSVIVRLRSSTTCAHH